MLSFLGVLATTPRVGQNAVLGSIRQVIPTAGEYGAARPTRGIMIYSAGYPVQFDKALRTGLVSIRRSDVVAQAISWEIASQTGRFHSWQDESDLTPIYNRQFIKRAIKRIEMNQQRWDEIFVTTPPQLELVYEVDIEPSPTHAAQMVLDAWGIAGKAGPTDVRRFDRTLKHEWRERWEAGF